MKRPRPEWKSMEENLPAVDNGVLPAHFSCLAPLRRLPRSEGCELVSSTRMKQSRGILATSSAGSSSSSSSSSSLDSNLTLNARAPSATSASSDALRNAVAGAMAAIFSRTVTAPIERVKLVLQLQRAPSALNPSSPASKQSSIPAAPTAPWNAWTVCQKIYTTEGGLWAFWRGNTPNILRQAGASALNFMLMDSYKAAMKPLLAATLALSPTPERDRSIVSSFLSGGLAGGTTTTVLYPIEFMRTRLALDVGSPRVYPGGMRDVVRQIWTTDGIRGFYQGYGIALAGVVVYRALHLGGYDACKTEVVHRRRATSTGAAESDSNSNSTSSSSAAAISVGERFLIAQVVSIVAGTICYPIDSVRRRLMMQAGQPPELRAYTSARNAFGTILRTEGVRGFYLGLGPNIVRSIAGALLLVSYDVFRGRIGTAQ